MTAPTPPTPPFRDPDLPFAERIDDLLSRLTLDERIGFLHQFGPAVERLGVAAFRTGQEALHGVAWMGPATVFPQAVGLGATWNEDLVRRVGEAVSREARAMRSRDERVGLNVWSPTVNLLRHPLWGRNEEGYSEDPRLTSAIATAYTRGLRGDHPVYWRTAPVLKHWLAHNNETRRDTTSSTVRPRVLHEYDLRAFRDAVEAGAVAGVMPAVQPGERPPQPRVPVPARAPARLDRRGAARLLRRGRAVQPGRLRALLRHARGGHGGGPARGRRQLHRPRHRQLEDRRPDQGGLGTGPVERGGRRHGRPAAAVGAVPARRVRPGPGPVRR